jgi:hypothetical protein
MQIGDSAAKPKALIARARTMVWTLMINLVVAMTTTGSRFSGYQTSNRFFQASQRLRGLARRSSALEHPGRSIAARAHDSRLSHTKLRRYPEILNPNGHKLGGSGTAGGYHLDHIFPISTCWEYKVPEVDASDVRNLQVIAWLVNLSRGSGIRLERLVGWPYPGKKSAGY